MSHTGKPGSAMISSALRALEDGNTLVLRQSLEIMDAPLKTVIPIGQIIEAAGLALCNSFSRLMSGGKYAEERAFVENMLKRLDITGEDKDERGYTVLHTLFALGAGDNELFEGEPNSDLLEWLVSHPALKSAYWDIDNEENLPAPLITIRHDDENGPDDVGFREDCFFGQGYDHFRRRYPDAEPKGRLGLTVYEVSAAQTYDAINWFSGYEYFNPCEHDAKNILKAYLDMGIVGHEEEVVLSLRQHVAAQIKRGEDRSEELRDDLLRRAKCATSSDRDLALLLARLTAEAPELIPTELFDAEVYGRAVMPFLNSMPEDLAHTISDHRLRLAAEPQFESEKDSENEAVISLSL